jgi:hypothetical protein
LDELLIAKDRNSKAARVNETSAVIQLSPFFDSSFSLGVDNEMKHARLLAVRCEPALDRQNFKTARNPKIVIRPYAKRVFDEHVDWKCVRIALETHCISLPRIQPQNPDRARNSRNLRFRWTKDGPFVHLPPKLSLFLLDFSDFASSEIGPWAGQIGCASRPKRPSERRKLTFRPLKGRWMDILDTLLGHFVYHKWNIPTVVMHPRGLCRQGQGEFLSPTHNQQGWIW